MQTQLTYLESCISYYKELVSLYDSFDGDKLVKILKDLGEADDEIASRWDLYSGYLDNLQKKYDITLSEINEYNQLLDALDTGDFEASMGVFNKAMEGYRAEGNDAMAENLQSVLDLLNERAIDAGNWGEFADEWLFEPDGTLSDYGRAKAALLVSQLEDSQKKADAYLD